MLAISTGQSILIEDHSYKITGVITYEQDNGSIYQEYLIADFNKDNQFLSWLEYCEGQLIRYSTLDIINNSFPDYKKVKVGSTISLSGKEIFITNKFISKVVNFEGSFPFKLDKGETSEIIEGIYNGYIVTLEFTEGQCEFSTGQIIPFPDKI